MSKLPPLAKYWLPAILWMVVIFSASSDPFSAQSTSRILGPFIHWLLPNLTDATVGQIVFAIRKTSHVVEYIILVWLLWRAWRRPVRGDPRPWDWSVAGWALLAAAAYAVADEIHQAFVPSRQGSGWDVLLDTCGAFCGLLLLWALGRRRKRG